MSTPTTFRLKRDRFQHKAGTTVYSSKFHDYGLARDDTRITGVQHVSVTLNADGSYPFFTVPERDLVRVVDETVHPAIAAMQPLESDGKGLDLNDDAPLAPACGLSGDGTCEACQ